MTKVIRVEPWQAAGRTLDGMWMRFELSDSGDGQMWCGQDEKGVCANVVSRALAAWPMQLGDVTGYAHQRGKNILRDGYIQCCNRLRREKRGWEAQPIGVTLGNPDDFSDYVFSGGEVSGKTVLSSKQAGRIVMDPHAPYCTGMRLYADARGSAQDGLPVRDGMYLKVADRLPLTPYLLFAAMWENVGLVGERSTLRAFTQAANRTFERTCGQKNGIMKAGKAAGR